MRRNVHTVWTSDIYDIESWREAFEDGDELSESELWERADELNSSYLDDERVNLNVELPTQIVCIADLGLWNGRRTGYKIIGNNIADCLYSQCDYNTWYVDSNGDFCCYATHHDGTNHYVYRAFKENLSETSIDNFLYKLISGDLKEGDISKYTKRIGPEIAKIYGFKCPGKKSA